MFRPMRQEIKLCSVSVVKHLESDRARNKCSGKHETSPLFLIALPLPKCFLSARSRVSPYTSFVLYHFLSALQQNRAQSRPPYLLRWLILFLSCREYRI